MTGLSAAVLAAVLVSCGGGGGDSKGIGVGDPNVGTYEKCGQPPTKNPQTCPTGK